ncbi:MAG TPA: hypothetical protein PK926_06120 [Spirochaetota bacterium]|nr:hypothetical protein [Spirochaetota bacterium]
MKIGDDYRINIMPQKHQPARQVVPVTGPYCRILVSQNFTDAPDPYFNSERVRGGVSGVNLQQAVFNFCEEFICLFHHT